MTLIAEYSLKAHSGRRVELEAAAAAVVQSMAFLASAYASALTSAPLVTKSLSAGPLPPFSFYHNIEKYPFYNILYFHGDPREGKGE